MTKNKEEKEYFYSEYYDRDFLTVEKTKELNSLEVRTTNQTYSNNQKSFFFLSKQTAIDFAKHLIKEADKLDD